MNKVLKSSTFYRMRAISPDADDIAECKLISICVY